MRCRDAITYEPSDLWAWGSVEVKGLECSLYAYAMNFSVFPCPCSYFIGVSRALLDPQVVVYNQCLFFVD